MEDCGGQSVSECLWRCSEERERASGYADGRDEWVRDVLKKGIRAGVCSTLGVLSFVGSRDISSVVTHGKTEKGDAVTDSLMSSPKFIC